MTRKWCEIRQQISVLQRQRRLQISRMMNIGSAFELSGVALRLVPPYGVLLVYSLHLAGISASGANGNKITMTSYSHYFLDQRNLYQH